MKKDIKRLKKLLIIFVAALSFLVINQKLSQSPKSEVKALPNFNKERVTGLKVTKDNQTREIFKKENKWYAKGKEEDEFPGDSDRVSLILDSLSGLDRSETISENKNKYGQFEVDGKKKVEFDLDSQKNSTVYIGKQFSISKTYFRIAKDPAVYIASNDLSPIFDPFDFRDLKPHLIDDENEVSFVDVSWDENKLSLTKKDDHWLTSSNKEAKRERVDYFVNDLNTLKGNDIIRRDKVELTALKKELTVVLVEKGKKKTGVFYKKDKNSYYLDILGSKYLLQIPGVYPDSFKKTEVDFLD